MTSRTRVPRAVSEARSREAILDAALELFAEQGFDETTTEQVADRAGVSPRTFFRYFPTKESVVFYRDFGLMRRFESELQAQSETRSDFDAICATFVALSRGFDELRERVQRYRRVVDSSSVLLGREHLHSQEHSQTIARALAHRHGREAPNDDDATLGALAVLLYNRAFAQWLDGGGLVDLGDRLDAEFARVRRVV
ncbi:MAG TPA: TetR family transcriptional regulator [Acidimicrobiia bacterium]|nr:TetR family transcriptional regulator [Acidimicrobiia bacterium]